MASSRQAFTAGKPGRRVACASRNHARPNAAAASPGATAARRSLLLATALAPLASPAPSPAFDLPFFGTKEPPLPAATVRDRTLAYTFKYPTTSTSGRAVPFVFSRKPEKYSSAAPLTADARQRIVTELVSLREGITCTVYVGPASGDLRGVPPAQWTAPRVANVVLTDRSSARNTEGRRVPLATVESADISDRGGVPYYVYEAVQSGSPNLFDVSKDTYRQSLCVSAARLGQSGDPYIYTLVLACPSTAFADMRAPFRQAVESFELLPPGKGYVPPDKDPWLFF